MSERLRRFCKSAEVVSFLAILYYVVLCLQESGNDIFKQKVLSLMILAIESALLVGVQVASNKNKECVISFVILLGSVIGICALL